jgi:hypothetical protein
VKFLSMRHQVGFNRGIPEHAIAKLGGHPIILANWV